MSISNAPSIIVLERNRRVGPRIARVIGAALGFDTVAYVDHSADVPSLVGSHTRLLACGERYIEEALDWFGASYPGLGFLVWMDEEPARIIPLAQHDAGLSCFIGWPSFLSMPRPWELALAARRLLAPHEPGPTLAQLLRWGGSMQVWQPASPAERDRVVAEISQAVLLMGEPARVAERMAELAHEMLMNAMYVAPVDAHGQPLYAHDRRQEIVLGPSERPTIRLGTDGMLLGLEVCDPFGRLDRQHMLGGVARGMAAIDLRSMDAVIDTAYGGAGLGMAKLYAGSAVLIADVVPGRATTVTSIHELDISPRELRSTIGSLHFFSRAG